jgi:hypothetical protein
MSSHCLTVIVFVGEGVSPAARAAVKKQQHHRAITKQQKLRLICIPTSASVLSLNQAGTVCKEDAEMALNFSSALCVVFAVT